VILSVPVLSLDRRKARAARISGRPAPSGPLSALRARSVARIERWVSRWRALDRVCLWTGYLLLLGSGLGRIAT